MDKVLCEMINQNLSYKIIKDEEDNIMVKLRPKSIIANLQGKFNPNDIEIGGIAVQQRLELNNIHTDLYRQCLNSPCTITDKSPFKSIPQGQPDAKIMFINNSPSDYEMYSMTSCSDKEGVFLSIIIDKLKPYLDSKNISTNQIYYTDVVKCNNVTSDECNYCINRYLKKEIDIIKPKLIICNGINTLYSIANAGIIENLPTSIDYGNIYTVTTSTGLYFNIIAINNLNEILQKDGNEYTQWKNILWRQMVTAVNSIA